MSHVMDPNGEEDSFPQHAGGSGTMIISTAPAQAGGGGGRGTLGQQQQQQQQDQQQGQQQGPQLPLPWQGASAQGRLRHPLVVQPLRLVSPEEHQGQQPAGAEFEVVVGKQQPAAVHHLEAREDVRRSSPLSKSDENCEILPSPVTTEHTAVEKGRKLAARYDGTRRCAKATKTLSPSDPKNLAAVQKRRELRKITVIRDGFASPVFSVSIVRSPRLK
ncbi:MAG: hypothetical protein BJ554DRAFT_1005 [Olpidium bornovanus]|uniref:Uncharacterized protein n=1 Tax=Olpidium bornovanus TaxID=278681 RepID=A0A8H7ZTD7_9FUNG|nr:MAG: hypothetical protein BJ554DRAFT_1005 [Olpidium bornovanus]